MKEEIMLIIFIGVIIGLFLYTAKQLTQNKKQPSPENISATEEVTPMTLRNGYGITRDKNPTFAEQWVNIMNYNGSSQREEFYEEAEGTFTENNLG